MPELKPPRRVHATSLAKRDTAERAHHVKCYIEELCHDLDVVLTAKLSAFDVSIFASKVHKFYTRYLLEAADTHRGAIEVINSDCIDLAKQQTMAIYKNYVSIYQALLKLSKHNMFTYMSSLKINLHDVKMFLLQRTITFRRVDNREIIKKLSREFGYIESLMKYAQGRFKQYYRALIGAEERRAGRVKDIFYQWLKKCLQVYFAEMLIEPPIGPQHLLMKLNDAFADFFDQYTTYNKRELERFFNYKDLLTLIPSIQFDFADTDLEPYFLSLLAEVKLALSSFDIKEFKWFSRELGFCYEDLYDSTDSIVDQKSKLFNRCVELLNSSSDDQIKRYAQLRELVEKYLGNMLWPRRREKIDITVTLIKQVMKDASVSTSELMDAFCFKLWQYKAMRQVIANWLEMNAKTLSICFHFSAKLFVAFEQAIFEHFNNYYVAQLDTTEPLSLATLQSRFDTIIDKQWLLQWLTEQDQRLLISIDKAVAELDEQDESSASEAVYSDEDESSASEAVYSDEDVEGSESETIYSDEGDVSSEFKFSNSDSCVSDAESDSGLADEAESVTGINPVASADQAVIELRDPVSGSSATVFRPPAPRPPARRVAAVEAGCCTCLLM